MNLRQFDLLHSVLGLGGGAVEGEVGCALVTLVDDALVIFLGHQVANFLISQGMARRSNRIDDLPGDFTKTRGFITSRLFNRARMHI